MLFQPPPLRTKHNTVPAFTFYNTKPTAKEEAAATCPSSAYLHTRGALTPSLPLVKAAGSTSPSFVAKMPSGTLPQIGLTPTSGLTKRTHSEDGRSLPIGGWGNHHRGLRPVETDAACAVPRTYSLPHCHLALLC